MINKNSDKKNVYKYRQLLQHSLGLEVNIIYDKKHCLRDEIKAMQRARYLGGVADDGPVLGGVGGEGLGQLVRRSPVPLVLKSKKC